MAKIHVPGDGHTAPVPSSIQYLPYSDKAKLKVVQDALGILKSNVRGNKSCNSCFSKLPNGKSFDDILDDDAVVIHYDPTNDGKLRGATRNGTKNVTITEYAIRMGRWMVASTLVHEFAHVDGAPGSTAQAEATLPPCGFGAAGHYWKGHVG